MKKVFTVLSSCALVTLLHITAHATTDSISVGKDSVAVKYNNIRTFSSSAFTEEFNLQIPQYTPKAPNTSSLVSHLDYPVSLYTGIPQISIPIYVIYADNIQIPITLSYHASGIRVNQEASWVGLGWSLNAGGMISRTIRCGDDFHEYVPPGGTLTEGYITSPEITGNEYDKYIGLSDVKPVLKKDSEPDIFFYTIPHASGKFIIDKSRGAVLVDKNTNLKIEYFSHDLVKKYFTITSPDGTVYTFKEYEKTSSYHRPGYLNQNMNNATKFDEYEDKLNLIYSSPFEYTSCWMLTDICTTNGRHVTFTYEKETYQAPVHESAEKYHITTFGTGNIAGPSEGEVRYSCCKTISDTWRLSQITWDGGYVVFDTNTREDEIGISTSTNPHKLVSIKIYNNIDKLIKETYFDYEYFNNSYTGAYPHVFKRLKLVGISEPSAEGCNYKFQYYEGTLPAKNSHDTDYWGYYNGIYQGANYYCPIIYNNVAFEGADKSSQFNYMIIGTLKSVTTPTKGMTTFVYEANRYKTTPKTSIVTHHKKEGINVFNEYNYDTYSQYPKTTTKTLTLSVPTSMSLYGFAENEGCTEDKEVRYDHDENATLKISKIKGDGSKQLVFYYPTPSEMKTECSYTFPFRTIELSEGDYIIEAEAHAKDTWYSFSYEYSKTEAITSDSIITGGGLRIKSIYGAEYKSYEYDDGKLLVDPVFGIKRIFEEYYQQPYSTLPVLCRTGYMVQQSDATIPMSTLKDGNIFGYTLIKEKTGDTTVSHYFHNEKEESQDEKYPYTPTKYDAFNGIEEKTVQDKRTTAYSYDTRKAKDIKAFIFNEENGEIYPYTYEIEWPLLSQVTTTTKEENGNIITTNAYTYNDNFMKETESISDVSGTYTKKHIYPKNGDTGILGTMANRYMTGVPVETLLLLDNKVIDGHRTSYINIGDLILPDEEYRITGISGLSLSEYDSSYISELKYSHYNSYGKPMQLDSKGISTVYLWSYDGTCPVAEIRNTTYTEVSAALSATFIDNITKKHVPADSDMSILNSLREKLPHAMVFTYTYIPLIGMTSITDERGFTIYYDYDASGRLYEKYIMTGGKKSVMERYRYNYRR